MRAIKKGIGNSRAGSLQNQSLFFSILLHHKGNPILLANPLQSSRSTFSWESFPGFFVFKEGMWDTQISALLSSPTVSEILIDRQDS
jgi:hypothetical protein